MGSLSPLNRERQQVMWKVGTEMNEPIKEEAKAILSICKKYGYGNVMEWASAFYRYTLKEKGLPPEHALVPVIPALCDKNDEGIALGEQTRELYDRMVHNLMERGEEK